MSDNPVPQLGRYESEVRPLTRRLLQWCQSRPITWWPERVQQKLRQYRNTEQIWLWLWVRLQEEVGMVVTGLVVFGALGGMLWALWVAVTCTFFHT